MPRKKKPKYEYIESRGLYRKRVKGIDGGFVAIYGKTPDELEDKLFEFSDALRTGLDLKANPYFTDYAQHWIDVHKQFLSHGAYVDYQSIINCHIKPPMEGKRIRDIEPEDIKKAMGLISDKSRSVYDKTYMLFKQIFTDAQANHKITDNPCPQMHAGGKDPKIREALTDDQVITLLDAIKDTPAYLFCMIGIYSGLRREEIMGLQWDCVHLDDTPRIDVRRAVRFVHNRPELSEKLKTKASRRTVPIPQPLADCLKLEKEKSISDFVVANNDGGPRSGTQYRRLWSYVVCRSTKERVYYRYKDGVKTAHVVKPVLGEKCKHNSNYYLIDFEVTPHMLRHTYITNLLLAGVDVKTVQYIAGHERAKITLDIYAHLTYNRPQEISEKIDIAFGRMSFANSKSPLSAEESHNLQKNGSVLSSEGS
jgi:Site-specific recombinase XerD